MGLPAAAARPRAERPCSERPCSPGPFGRMMPLFYASQLKDKHGRKPIMLTRRQALHQFGAASLGLALADIAPQYAAAADEIVVGNLLDSTGPINIYGLPMVDATKFAIDDINA